MTVTDNAPSLIDNSLFNPLLSEQALNEEHLEGDFNDLDSVSSLSNTRDYLDDRLNCIRPLRNLNLWIEFTRVAEHHFRFSDENSRSSLSFGSPMNGFGDARGEMIATSSFLRELRL